MYKQFHLFRLKLISREWSVDLKAHHILLLLILVLALFARAWQFGLIPADINQDEAFAGYEAYSLLHDGMDSAGYRFPVYLTAWGSGMNVLNSLLMIPFIAVFGLKTWVIRLPQLLITLLTILAVYALVKELSDTAKALWCAFFLAAAPWHIMLARWGLESNLAPGFLVFGLYFFVKGIRKPACLLISALMYGLALYTYATIWPIVPLLLLLQLLYARSYITEHFRLRESLLSVLLLGLLALPLLLFLLINAGYMEEIRTPFLSIPKLVYMRSSQISLHNLPQNARTLIRLLLTQNDGLIWNSTSRFGLFYRFSLPFFFAGLGFGVLRAVRDVRTHRLSLELLLFIQLFCALLLGLLIDVNVNRINCIWIPVILFAALGLYELSGLLSRYALILPVLLTLIFFLQFEHYYFTAYEGEAGASFSYGLENAMETALAAEGPVYVSRSASYARVLFYARENVSDYIATVEYTNYPASVLDVRRFGRFCFDIDASAPDPDGIYIIDRGVDTSAFEREGFEILESGIYRIARKRAE